MNCRPLSTPSASPCQWRWRCQRMNERFWGFEYHPCQPPGTWPKFHSKKYGPHPDHRKAGLTDLFNDLSRFLSSTIPISSDECSFYDGVVRQYFPKAIVNQHTGKKSSVAGQGELKKTRFDPIFSINHTFAMLRANISRLIRKTWNTTKKVSCLICHLNIYVWMHNTKKNTVICGISR